MEYIGTSEEMPNADDLEEDDDGDWEVQLNTEVLILRIHQEWCSKGTWAMWAPTETRKEVATRWLRRRRLEGFLEPDGLSHPRVYGVEPAAIATISMRVDISNREEFLLAVGTEDGIPNPVAESLAPEGVWLCSPQYPVTPSVANMARALEKMYSIEDHRELVMSEMGPGI